MNDKSSEMKRIEALYGPYAGTQIDIPTADADAAIADGWARDPFATPDPNAEPKEWSQEAHDKAMIAAEKAARKFRGEEEDVKAKKGVDKKKDSDVKTDDDRQDETAQPLKTTSMQAGDDPAKGYETRRPGRPKGS